MKCRNCGSGNTISRGYRILCKDCGKQSIKILRRNTPHIRDRPTCPECGSPNPFAGSLGKGKRMWVCRSCGRHYANLPEVDRIELPILEVQVE